MRDCLLLGCGGVYAALIVFAAAAALVSPAAASPHRQLSRLFLETLRMAAGSRGDLFAAEPAAAPAAIAKRHRGPTGAAASAAKALQTVRTLALQEPLLQRHLEVSFHLIGPTKQSRPIYRLWVAAAAVPIAAGYAFVCVRASCLAIAVPLLRLLLRYCLLMEGNSRRER